MTPEQKKNLQEAQIKTITRQSGFARDLAMRIDTAVIKATLDGFPKYAAKIRGSSRLQDDIRRLRRELLELSKLIDEEV
jgi:hypothetical protein